MKKTVHDILKKYSRGDNKSLQKLEDLFSRLNEEADKYRGYLDLLERTIQNDYDSIIITELELKAPGPRIVYVNEGFTRMTGYGREEVVGKTPRILQGEKTDRAVLDKLKKRLQAGQPFFGHTVNYRKDGSEFVNQWDIHPLADKNGLVSHWVSYQHDVTERKRMEKTLSDTRVEFDNLEEDVRSIIIDLDEKGNIVSANKAFRELVGFDVDDLRQFRIWDLLSSGDSDSFREKFDMVTPDNFINRNYDLALTPRHGEEIEVIASTKLLSSNGHKIIRVRFVNRSLQKRIMNMLAKRGRHHDQILGKRTDFGYKAVRKGGEYVFSTITDSFSTVTGMHEDKIIGSSVKTFVFEDDWPKVRRHLNIVMGGKSNTEIYKIRTRSGQMISVMDSANPVGRDKPGPAHDGDVSGIRGNVSIEISSEQKFL
ncbi:MAG: PAS domain S-box protein [Balneolaceae bacterium]